MAVRSFKLGNTKVCLNLSKIWDFICICLSFLSLCLPVWSQTNHVLQVFMPTVHQQYSKKYFSRLLELLNQVIRPVISPSGLYQLLSTAGKMNFRSQSVREIPPLWKCSEIRTRLPFLSIFVYFVSMCGITCSYHCTCGTKCVWISFC